jgi:hypothetical protein
MISDAVSNYTMRGLILALVVAVALPEELPAAPLVNVARMQPTFALTDSLATKCFAYTAAAHRFRRMALIVAIREPDITADITGQLALGHCASHGAPHDPSCVPPPLRSPRKNKEKVR